MTRAATPADVESWWTRWPEANIGVVTGPSSGVVVIDVDPRGGGDSTLADLESRVGPLPPTVISLTGGGGRHLWFAQPERPVPSRELGPGLEIKGSGGMVVVPPSRHTSGGTYRWVPGRAPDEHDLAALPDWTDAVSSFVRTPRTADTAGPRTVSERADFHDLWARVGVTVGDGDVMVLCPFHDDHHPSLHVDAEGCRWFCFGCRRGGGIGVLRRLVEPDGHDRPDAQRPLGRATLVDEVMVEVVGESAHQDELLELCGGRRRWAGVRYSVIAELVPDDMNPVDPMAVAVVIDGRPVGYLARADSSRHRPTIDRAIEAFGTATCHGQIRGGWERPHGDVGRFGVVLWLPDLA